MKRGLVYLAIYILGVATGVVATAAIGQHLQAKFGEVSRSLQ
jgi:hypothetical protein